MARNRHIIRKTQPVRYQRIDDQLWPLVVAMVVLGGFLAGSVLAYLRLDDPRWFANAWTWLIAIPLIIAAALVALAWTGNRLLRRTMQLSIVLGVIIHVVMFLAAVETDVFHRAWIEVLASADRPPQKKSREDPRLHVVATRSRASDAPRFRATGRVAIARSDDPAGAPGTDAAQASHDGTAAACPTRAGRRPATQHRERAEPNQAVPRQRDEMSQLSRKEATVPSRPTQLAELPSVVPRPQRREESPRPEEIGLRPQPRTADVAALKQQTRAQHA